MPKPISLEDLTPELEVELYPPHTAYQRELQDRAALAKAGLIPPQPLSRRQLKRRRECVAVAQREVCAEFVTENPGCGIDDVIRGHPLPGQARRAILWLLRHGRIVFGSHRNPEGQEPGLYVPKAKSTEPKKPRPKLPPRAVPRSKTPTPEPEES